MSEIFFFIDQNICNLNELDFKINNAIQEKKSSGQYDGLNYIDDIFTVKFSSLEDEQHMLDYYLKAIQDHWAIDINDFNIPRKNGFCGFLEYGLKKIIWKCLKFYTFRLFSQQLEYNSMLTSTLVAVEKDMLKKIDNLNIQLESCKLLYNK